MDIIKLTTKSDKNGHLQLDIPTAFPNRTVELKLTLRVVSPKKKKKYDFSDLSGKLKWAGSSVETQRNIRNEW